MTQPAAEHAHISPGRSAIWYQLGAAIDSLENAITACPDALWGDRAHQPEYFYLAYHTLFFLDYYLSPSADGFHPPAPFNLDELDPAGVLPDRVFTKDELLGYLAHGRQKARALVASLTDETAREIRRFNNRDWTVLEWLVDGIRHVQHHTAQLNLIRRQQTDSPTRWIHRASAELAPSASAPVHIPRDILWHRFGAAIDMLENAIAACPDGLWSDGTKRPEYWKSAYHTLFFLDLYLSDTDKGFAPPPPFTTEALNASIVREQPYTRDEALAYLRHCREKCRARIAGLTDEGMAEIRTIFRREWTVLEWLLYNMRHVQHHAAQFNLILRQQTDCAPNWVGRTAHPLEIRP